MSLVQFTSCSPKPQNPNIKTNTFSMKNGISKELNLD